MDRLTAKRHLFEPHTLSSQPDSYSPDNLTPPPFAKGLHGQEIGVDCTFPSWLGQFFDQLLNNLNESQ